jgi:glucan phosphoethanolaminetransferase (alkaline phosphatase superfamily)
VWWARDTPGLPHAILGGKRSPAGDNPAMALRLFRTTGYSTLLMPGEARMAPHPAKAGFWASVWLAVACNVAVWRVLAGGLELAPAAVASAAIIGGGSGVVFSLLGWRRTLKPAITIALIAGALIACGMWSQQLPVDALWRRPPRSLLPSWADFMRWQVLVLVLVLAVVPIVTLWNTSLRRLPGPTQLRANLLGAILAAAVLAVGIFIA